MALLAATTTGRVEEEDTVIVAGLTANAEVIANAFSRAVSSHELRQELDREDTPQEQIIAAAAEDRWIAQLMIASQAMISDASILSERGAARLLHTQSRVRNLAVLITLVLVGGILIMSLAATRFIARGLRRLHEGTERIGRGDLDYRIALDSRDEFGALAKAFDDMSERLIFLSCYDLTDLRRAEQALRRTAEELRRSNEDLRQFAYISSHHLQEPLRMVNSFLKLLDMRYKQQLDDKAREYINFALEGATRMSHLIYDLLDYSRLDRQGKGGIEGRRGHDFLFHFAAGGPMIAARRPVTMLMVEDNPADVYFSREALEETALPVTLHVVTNGLAAMEFLGRREEFANAPRPDVVVLDLNLPVMNGKELLAKMMSDPEFCRLPVAVLTTSRSETHLSDLYPPDRFLCFTKTDDLHRLQDIIGKIAAHAGM